MYTYIYIFKITSLLPATERGGGRPEFKCTDVLSVSQRWRKSQRPGTLQSPWLQDFSPAAWSFSPWEGRGGECVLAPRARACDVQD